MDTINDLLKLLSKRPLGLICGKLLGDANLTIEKNKKPRLRFQHSIKDREWCEFCYDCLKEFIPLAPPKYKYSTDLRLRNGFSESIYVQSKTSNIFILLRNLWYENKKKVVPIKLIDAVLTPEAIAWWYQDDGSLKAANGKPQKIILSTNSFSMEENKELIKLLFKKFKLKFSLDGQNRLCIYDQPQIHRFLFIINNFIHPSMVRKKLSNPNINNSQYSNNKRTTIYLPSDIAISYPTKDINNIIDRINEETFIMFSQQIIKSNNKLNKMSYQIVLTKEHLEKLYSLKIQTGFSYSQIVTTAFLFYQ